MSQPSDPATNIESATLSLARDLMQRQSVTPADEGCQALMIERLQNIGFEIHDLPFGDDQQTVKNFWAIRGKEGPILAFAGHTDVVPPGKLEAWKYPPFSATVEDGMLYGRGAADMKGSLACMIVACESFIAEHPNHSGRIAFLITSDEEGPAQYGTVKVVEWLESRGEKITWCLVGEPSSSKQVGDTIKNGRRGSLGAELTVLGIQGHVAYPHLAENPIHSFAPALVELSTTIWDEGNAFFPATSFQISNLNSGTGATNIIPGAAHVIFNFRFSTELTHSEIKVQVEDILNRHELEYELEWKLSGEPFLTAEGELVEACKKSIKASTNLDTRLSTSGGTSDGRFIAPTGAQVVELGPVNATIHQVNERVSVDDLEQLTEIYQGILTELLAK